MSERIDVAADEHQSLRDTPLWARLRAEMDRAVDSILDRIVASTSDQSGQALAAIEASSAERLGGLEDTRLEMEQELNQRITRLIEVCAEIEAERTRSTYRSRILEELHAMRQARAPSAIAPPTFERVLLSGLWAHDPGSRPAVQAMPAIQDSRPDEPSTAPKDAPAGPVLASPRVEHAIDGVTTFRKARQVTRALAGVAGVRAVRVLDYDDQRLVAEVFHDLADALIPAVRLSTDDLLLAVPGEPARLALAR